MLPHETERRIHEALRAEEIDRVIGSADKASDALKRWTRTELSTVWSQIRDGGEHHFAGQWEVNGNVVRLGFGFFTGEGGPAAWLAQINGGDWTSVPAASASRVIAEGTYSDESNPLSETFNPCVLGILLSDDD